MLLMVMREVNVHAAPIRDHTEEKRSCFGTEISKSEHTGSFPTKWVDGCRRRVEKFTKW
jgi:hypothetical protein